MINVHVMIAQFGVFAIHISMLVDTIRGVVFNKTFIHKLAKGQNKA